MGTIDERLLGVLDHSETVFWTATNGPGGSEHYAVTNERVAVIDAARTRVKHAIKIADIADVTWDQRPDGGGTLLVHARPFYDKLDDIGVPGLLAMFAGAPAPMGYRPLLKLQNLDDLAAPFEVIAALRAGSTPQVQ